MQITATSQADCGNVGAYFSGYYCTYGVHFHVVCNADSSFHFFSIAAPGKTNDSIENQKTFLPLQLDSLPLGYFIATDCAYFLLEHLTSP